MTEISIQKTTRPGTMPDEDKLGFGTHFTDHMFVMDYQTGDLAVTEVVQQLCRVLPRGWQLHFTQINSFKTTETGFVTAQLALAPRVPEDPPLVLYVNCAPRKDTRHSRGNNEGEGLVYGVLPNGVHVVAVNSKYSLSLLRDHFLSLQLVNVSAGGSQFRSRDNFPVFVGAVAQHLDHGKDLAPWLGAALDPASIKPFKEGYIGYIDSFGNIKTTFRSSSPLLQGIQPGQEVELDINGTELVARVATGSFNIPEGNFAFAPGSSGGNDRFWEIFQRGHNAAQSFKNPQVGAEVKVRLLPVQGKS